MSKIITVTEFQTYTNYYEENMESMLQTYIDSAENIVENYLGYDPTENDYEEIITSIGSDKLYTRIPHISEFSYVIDKDTDEMLTDCISNENYIYDRNGEEVFKEGRKYKVCYVGGWSSKEMPADIRMAVLRIASVQLAESDGNIGLSSKSFADMSRSFMNYTSYDKFLKPLLPYRSKAIL